MLASRGHYRLLTTAHASITHAEGRGSALADLAHRTNQHPIAVDGIELREAFALASPELVAQGSVISELRHDLSDYVRIDTVEQ